MGYQFAHINTYSQSGGKKGDFKVSGCLGEAFRDEGFTDHIENPNKKIELLHGDRQELEAAIKDYQENFKDSRGHKLRKDGKNVMAGVFSWPPGTTAQEFKDGKKILLDFLKEEYGPSLRCVLVHEDEPFKRGKFAGQIHYHVHFFVVPEPSQNMKEYHPGLKAKAEARASGDDISKQDIAYKKAMGDWQNKINSGIGQKIYAHGEPLIRLGPQLKRLSRREQKILDDAQKEAAEIEKQAQARASGIVADGERMAADLITSAEVKFAGLDKREADIKKREKAAAGRENEAEKREEILKTAVQKRLQWADVEPPKMFESGRSFFDRVGVKIAAVIAYLADIEKQFKEELKRASDLLAERKKELAEQKKLTTQMKYALDRLDGKYGDAKEFQQWKAARDAERRAAGTQQKKDGPSW